MKLFIMITCILGFIIQGLFGHRIGPRGGIHDPLIDTGHTWLVNLIGNFLIWGSIALGVWTQNNGMIDWSE